MKTGCRYNQAVLEEMVVRVFGNPTTKKQMADKSSKYQEWSTFVIVKEDNLPRRKRSLDRITDVLPSEDSIVRVVRAKQQKEDTYDQQ